MKSPISVLHRLAAEQPFRLFVKATLAALPCSVETRARWDICARPHYLVGILFAAEQARAQSISEISVIEFGVAGGNGLLILQAEAETVERETGVAIRVYGFDAGPGGLPSFCGDFRDHPDLWKPGDYPMDEDLLRSKLATRTTLILGDIRNTIERFHEDYKPAPIGFMSIDLDLYSSSIAALRILDICSVMRHVAIYCDDIDLPYCHRWAGELLAIEEFNQKHANLKIDRWRGLRYGRPFPEAAWLDRMFMFHDLNQISNYVNSRKNLSLPLGR